MKNRSNNKYCKLSFLAGAICLLLLSACEKSANNYSSTPFIRLTDIQPSTLKEFEQKVQLSIEFRDAEGDIGSYDPNIYDLEVLDQRLTEPDYYHLIPLAPEGTQINLTGLLQIELKNTFLLGNADQESVSYEIRLRDRAGNWSNQITSPPITVHK